MPAAISKISSRKKNLLIAFIQMSPFRLPLIIASAVKICKRFFSD